MLILSLSLAKFIELLFIWLLIYVLYLRHASSHGNILFKMNFIPSFDRVFICVFFGSCFTSEGYLCNRYHDSWTYNEVLVVLISKFYLLTLVDGVTKVYSGVECREV